MTHFFDAPRCFLPRPMNPPTSFGSGHDWGVFAVNHANLGPMHVKWTTETRLRQCAASDCAHVGRESERQQLIVPEVGHSKQPGSWVMAKWRRAPAPPLPCFHAATGSRHLCA